MHKKILLPALFMCVIGQFVLTPAIYAQKSIFETAIEVKPTEATPHYWLGKCFEKCQGNFGTKYKRNCFDWSEYW